MRIFFTLIVFIIPIFCNSQSLGVDRIERLNSSVVRILIDSYPSGTGFFVSDNGLVATCNHVIEPAYIRDKNTNKIIGLRKLDIEFQNGEKIEMAVLPYLLQEGYKNASSYDYSLLKIQSIPKTKYKKLKIGKWADINDGDAIYTCGYPMGIKQRFISQGILSTKWVNAQLKDSTPLDTIKRNVAWLDLTMNKGNSGGAIIKIGATPEDDKVIGLATFILNPFAQEATYLVNALSDGKPSPSILNSPLSLKSLGEFYAKAVANNSIGVSGCVSIDYVSDILLLMDH